MNSVCGIDFGTSNSAVGVATTKDDLSLVDLDYGKTVIPTAVFYRNWNKRAAVFGETAQNFYFEKVPGRFMRGLKTILSSPLIDDRTIIGQDSVSFKEIIGDFIQNLKTKAEEKQENLKYTVMGRPVHFSDNIEQDKLAEDILKNTAIKLGFEDVSFQYEPIAAALDYEQHVTDEKLAFVADLGGGTSDFSVIKLHPDNFLKENRFDDILSNDSVHIAGTDLDYKVTYNFSMPLFGLNAETSDNLSLPNWIFSSLSSWERTPMLYERKNLNRIRDFSRKINDSSIQSRLLSVLENENGYRISFATEAAKVALSTKEKTIIDLYEVEPYLYKNIDREKFEETVSEEVGQIIGKAADTIKMAQIPAQKIDTILLTGGTSKVPIIRDSLKNLCPNATIQKIDTFSSVARGLTIEALKRYNVSKVRD